MLRKVLLLLLILPTIAQAQILDDSTKQVYSLKTVGFRVESQVFLNDTTLNNPDSSMHLFQRANANQKTGWLFQDLGNVGTASRPIFFQERSTAETQLGYNAFDLYRQKTNGIQYYNTRSPYTKMEYLQTGKGVANLRFLHSRNIKPNWNITIDADRTSSSKQINPGTNREERLINGWNVILSSNYTSKSKRYTAIGHLNHLNFQQIEQGGIFFNRDQFTFPLDSVTLTDNRIDGSSRTYKNDFYLFQQLKLASGFDAYHRATIESNKFGFDNQNVARNADSTFYSFFSAPPDSVSWQNKNLVVQNAVGLKGYYRGFLANVYAKQRYFQLRDRERLFNNDAKILALNEFFIGGGIRYVLRDSVALLNASVEINLPASFVTNANLRIRQFDVNFSLANTRPDIIFQRSVIPNYAWNNSFKNQTTLKIGGNFNYRYKKLMVRPMASYQLIDNYIYFNQDARPDQQIGLQISLLTIGATAELALGKFNFRNEFYFNQTSSSVYPLPTIINNFQVYYDFNYAGALDIRIGVDNFYKSAYNAPAYNPVNQQFYLQDNVPVWGYNVSDAFVSFRVRRVRIALKFAHVNQNIIPNKTLIVTPFYPGMRRAFNLHIDWPLFD